MKVKYIGMTSPLELTNGKIYDIISIERGWYRINDDTEDDYLYPPECFEIVEGSADEYIDRFARKL